MVDRIRWDTVSYLPFYYVFFQFLLLTIFNLQANILTTKDILSNLAREEYLMARLKRSAQTPEIGRIFFFFFFFFWGTLFFKKEENWRRFWCIKIRHSDLVEFAPKWNSVQNCDTNIEVTHERKFSFSFPTKILLVTKTAINSCNSNFLSQNQLYINEHKSIQIIQ